MKRTCAVCFGIATILFAGVCVYACARWLSLTDDPQPEAQQAEPEGFVMTVESDYVGVKRPKFKKPADAGFSENAEVIGICVNGVYRAYPIKLLSVVDLHIVNDVFDGVPVSVTYCDRADQVRVLTWTNRDHAIPLDVGGLDENGHLLYLFGGNRYPQTCEELPLEDYPFERTGMGHWTSRHPNTLVFVSD